ncbi:NAD(P)/FAD-dependent oxidoreductase [Defluviimonas sp. WL0024]|uniref:Pyridine nucleotide-disulfide oxidoreductase domain-containing protein 2 n=1 Tax=Albidovulum salinarum TaxID=2984153 RepID=A0ABT2X5D6_9RHOB|nr:NAD(P)/FAD-dependent oxidoreductase [Defluviimonas sp. WL0024]MCU9849148.1 NAD(P)/FAD-dependent oxidoreductase [Defluviimonas sp. WL0024]
MPSYDTIIIGGGTNGLACAARLAKAGKRVLVLEAAERAGGGATGAALAPDLAPMPLAHLLTTLDPRVLDGMELERHGLSYAATGLTTTALSPTGDHLVLEGPAGAGLSGTIDDAGRAAWEALRRRLMSFAEALAPFRAVTPPRIARKAGNDNLKLARIGLGLRRLGQDEFREFLRMALINIADVLEDEIADDRLRGLVAFDAVLGAWLGPRSPNSLILYLNRLAGEAAGTRAALALPRGGMGAVADAMARSAEAAGVTLRTGARVGRVLIEEDRACGVILADGEEIRAGLVVSAIGPKATFLDLVGARHLDTGFVRRATNIRARGGAAKLHLALKGAPDFRGADPATRLVIAPDIASVEEAFNATKYGEVPERPVMEIVLPKAHEREAGGGHVLSAIVQFAPHAPRAGLDEARRRMLANTLEVLETYAPGIGGLITHSELLMPQDIEARYGMAGGNWHHAELSVEQMLFLRPFAEVAQYATPVAGLWLAGAGSHPGGGVSGAAGWNAAERILSGVAA